MGLFNKKPSHICEISYDDVVTYLRDMEQQDYTKILKVVSTYRDADKKVKKILNIKENDVTDPATADALAEYFLSDTDTSLGNFLEDEPAPKPPKKAKKK